MSDVVHVSYDGDRAQVRIGTRALQVDRRDDDSRGYTCPIELVSAALGA